MIVDGKHVKIKFWLGGDLKFINAMLSLSGNSSIYPCPCCLVCDRKDSEYLFFTRDQLQTARVEDRTIEMIMHHAHVHDAADYDCILCKHVKKKIKSVSVTSTSLPMVFENDNQRRHWKQLHFNVSPQRRPFFYFIPVSRIVTDILHIELRIIPVLWKVTVFDRCRDAAHLEDIC